MSVFKRVKVVMLSTNEKATEGNIILMTHRLNKSFLSIIDRIEKQSNVLKVWQRDGHLVFKNHQPVIDVDWPHVSLQHLYFLSDEEIKDNDWFIKMNYKGGKPTLYQECKKAFMNSEWLNSSDVKDCFKVIATTNKSLNINTQCKTYQEEHCGGYCCGLSQPSESFIEVFVKEYNKSNIITDVMVEYNEITLPNEEGVPNCFEGIELKVNPKDNTISIRKVKDSWSKEEVIELLLSFNSIAEENGRVSIGGGDGTNIHNWIERNL